MIVVRCDQTGDWAEAESPEAAVVAARTLCDDADRAHGAFGYAATASFYVAGKPVATRVPEAAIWNALGVRP